MWSAFGYCVFFFSSRRRHTRLQGDWSSDVCSSDLVDHIDLTPTSFNFVSVGQTGTLTAKVTARPGATLDVTIPTFSTSNAAVASVNQIGRASCRERV